MHRKKLKIAVAGVGYWGEKLVSVFHRLGVLDTICDLNPQRLNVLKRKYANVKATLSYKDILEDSAVNAVVISVPAELHYRFAKDSLLAGKDVFVEKPLSLTVENGVELIKLSDRYRKILMVGHILEYHPAVVRLKEIIKKGELGRIQYIYSNRLNLGRFRKEENILWSFAPHDISAMLLILGEVPESVCAHGGNYLHRDIADVTVSNLSFASGVKGHIFVSWLHPYKEQKLIIVGDKKMAVFDDVAEKDKLLVFNHKIDWIDRIPVSKKENAERISFKAEEPLLLECRHFLHCLKTREQPKTDAKSALRVLGVLEACQISLETNGACVRIDSLKDYSLSGGKYYAHPTSTIERPCHIGEGTKLWHYAHVMKGAKIGRNCNIGQNVFIGAKAEIGNNVKIQNNVSVYDCVKIEDDVFCGPSVVFTNVFNPRSFIERKNEFRRTLVRKGATLGANATIICGHTIGEYAFIGAGAVVTRDIPSYALAYGTPAKINGWICECGVKLNFVNRMAKCSACGKKYIFKKSIVARVSED